MLKQRILTAIFLIPLFLLLLFFSPPFFFWLFTAFLVLLGAWEWSSLMGLKKILPRLLYLILLTLLMVSSITIPIEVILISGLITWIIAALLVFLYPRARLIWGKGIFLRGVLGLLVLIPCWRAINLIRGTSLNGVVTLLFLFILIWGADTGAYFAGRKWGKHKLAPEVSPGKTWEGLLGGLIAVVVIAITSLIWAKTSYSKSLAILALSIITLFFSVLGDLFESMLKRNVGLKDSGHILPGHGGILDRIDSLTAAAPIFALGLHFISVLNI